VSPTLLRVRGLRVVIYPKDHAPPHVHVLDREGNEAKFRLSDLVCVYNKGFTQKTINEMEGFLRTRTQTLWEAWYEWHD
jgi:hypothetical protein